jgi:hypothetical protein
LYISIIFAEAHVIIIFFDEELKVIQSVEGTAAVAADTEPIKLIVNRIDITIEIKIKWITVFLLILFMV